MVDGLKPGRPIRRRLARRSCADVPAPTCDLRLSLLLGEMERTAGNVEVDRSGGVGLVPQSAWIVNASLRENIVMERPFDVEWYGEVVRACALERDVAGLSEGDATEIGERGVTISGGQKARLSLARALYGKPALLLLDDPLSAVDQHVAQHLVREAIVRLAKQTLGASVILVSHQLQFAAGLADHLVLLSHGCVQVQGTVEELASQGLLGSARSSHGTSAGVGQKSAAPIETAVPAIDAPAGDVPAGDAPKNDLTEVRAIVGEAAGGATAKEAGAERAAAQDSAVNATRALSM